MGGDTISYEENQEESFEQRGSEVSIGKLEEEIKDGSIAKVFEVPVVSLGLDIQLKRKLLMSDDTRIYLVTRELPDYLDETVEEVFEADPVEYVPTEKYEEEIKMASMPQNVYKYINNFRTEFGAYLDGSIGHQFNVASSPSGVVIVIKRAPYIDNTENFKGDFSTLGDALNSLDVEMSKFLKQQSLEEFNKAVSQNVLPSPNASKFYLAGDEILVFKGQDDMFWSRTEAKSNVQKIVSFLSKQKNG